MNLMRKHDTYNLDILNAPHMNDPELRAKLQHHFELRKLLLYQAHKLPYWFNYFVVGFFILHMLAVCTLTLVYAMQFSRTWHEEESASVCEDSMQEILNKRKSQILFNFFMAHKKRKKNKHQNFRCLKNFNKHF